MSTLKKYAKYIIWIILFYIFTNILIFIGFNSNYHAIQLKQDLPEQVTIKKAESTKAQGRIYGDIENSSENNINGKYIKATIYNVKDEKIATEYVKITDLSSSSEKPFRLLFTASNATSYTLEIVDNENE